VKGIKTALGEQILKKKDAKGGKMAKSWTTGHVKEEIYE